MRKNIKASPRLQDQTVTVYAHPKARTNKVEPFRDGLKIHVTAAPEHGKANDAILEHLSVYLKIPKKQIILIRGQHHRTKVYKITCERIDE